MFYELSLKKTFLMVFAVLTIVGGVLMFISINTSTHGIERLVQFVGREESSLVYSLLYNPPWKQTAAVASVATQGEARAIPVLLYHGTPPEGDNNPPLPQAVFVDQMKALKADGWQTITLEQFQNFMKNGAPLPAKSFLLTFDDGRKESFYPVDPVLQQLGYNAVMFVITGFSLPQNSTKSSTFYLDQSELQYMVSSGRWELESHGDQDHRLYDVPTATSTGGILGTIKDEHFLSNKFWLPQETRVETTAEFTTRITNDLTTSKQILEQDFGKPVTAFAYPFNDYGQNSQNFPQARDILANAVSSLYTFAFYQINPYSDEPFNYPDPTAVNIKRIEPTASSTGAELVGYLDAANAKELPYVSKNVLGEWSNNWGNLNIQNSGILSLRSFPNTTGAAALLNGSRWWQDYSVDAKIKNVEGSAVSLIARYQSDSETFLSCAFSDNRIDIQTHEGGNHSIIKSVAYPGTVADASEVVMSVKGNDVSCSTAGVQVEATVDASFVHPGSTGIQIWGPELGAESMDATNISVQND